MQMAIMDSELTVVNIIEYTDNSGIAGQFPLGWSTWDCTGVPVVIGDKFDPETGAFSRDGAPIEREPSDKERIEQLEAVIAALVGGEDR